MPSDGQARTQSISDAISAGMPGGLTNSCLPSTQALVSALLAFITQDGCSDAEFDAMALRLFEHQYTNNAPLRRFFQGRGVTPRRIRHWHEIPAVPINAFKELTLSCEPPEACARVFMTSGTTRAEVKGKHHHPTIEVWDLSMRRGFEHFFMQGLPPQVPMALLFPPEEELGNSSLGRYLSQAKRLFGAPGSGHFVSTQGMDLPGLMDFLHRAEAGSEPVALLGASYAFVHLLDALATEGRRVQLPAGSRLLDTGGYKRQSRELALDDFYDQLAQALGLPRTQCINMYGMTELSSQFYDAGNDTVPSVKRGMHWIRSRVVNPLTGAEVPPGQVGVLVHCDLASFNSTTTILTEDLGRAVHGGFELLGRAEGAQARGCSLAVQEFLQGARG
jgi:hypothetical protein